MIRNRALRRVVVAFCLLTILTNIFAPTLSFALTSGPTAPEASTFEPVDTTDMVNLPTGDFTYNIPLIEVPGPGGGYPLALAYHAGIKPDMDASWAGLGWNINAGAINRMVSGYADDAMSPGVNRSYWKGNTSWYLQPGVTTSKLGEPGFAAKLSIANDAYRGFSAGISASGGGKQFSFSTSGSGMDVGVSTRLASFSSKSGVGLNSGDIPTARIIPVLEGAMANGASIASVVRSTGQMLKGALPVTVENARSGHVTTKGFALKQITLPTQAWIGVNLTLAAVYRRSKINELQNSTMYGSLFLPAEKLSMVELANRSFDAYDLPEVQTVNNVTSVVDDDRALAGTFLDYDSYQVSGQGVGGSMRPYHFKSLLYRQTQIIKNDDDDEIIKARAYPLSGTNSKANFRFEDELSNKYTFTNLNFGTLGADHLPFDPSTNPTNTGTTSISGYDPINNSLAGAKHVDWASNFEMSEPNASQTYTKGFLNCNARGFNRSLAPSTAIGAFKVTNETGVTYHYSLPVYSYLAYSYNGKEVKNSIYYSQVEDLSKNAYTWLLTAITGPDFQDENSNGLADSGDLGYWVSFEYGKWTDKYIWRNPSIGFHHDLDQEFQYASKGRKEIYYLDAIKTQSHTAIFVKEIRADGKGVTEYQPEIARRDGDNVHVDQGRFDVEEGSRYPTSVLRLNKILLFRNQDFVWNLPNQSTAYNDFIGETQVHYGSNVIDIHDLTAYEAAIAEAALSGVVLNTNYELCRETPNSFFTTLDVPSTPMPYQRLGKLTLQSVQFLGRQSSATLPPTVFKYDLDDEPMTAAFEVRDELLRIDPVKFPLINSKVSVDDLVSFSEDGHEYNGIVMSKGTEVAIMIVTNIGSSFQSNILQNFKKTKNPLYNQRQYDIWGYYKPDVLYPHRYFQTDFAADEDILHTPSSTSAKSVDAWSLRKIITPVGSEISIQYESDVYENAIKTNSAIEVANIERDGDAVDRLKFTFYGKLPEDVIVPDEKYRVTALLRKDGTSPFAPENRLQCAGQPMGEFSFWQSEDENGTSKLQALEVHDDYVIFSCESSFYKWFKEPSLLATGGAPDHPLRYFNKATLNDAHGDTFNAALYEFTSPAVVVSAQIVDLPHLMSRYGGGLRVKSISVKNMDITTSTNYEYDNGITSYEPLGFQYVTQRLDADDPECVKKRESDKIALYNSEYYMGTVFKRFTDLIAYSRELPPPGVSYGKVNVSETLVRHGDSSPLDFPGHTEYEFEVFHGDLLKDEKIAKSGSDHEANPITVHGLTTKSIKQGAFTLENFSSRVGLLKNTKYFDASGKLMNETRNKYLHDGLTHDNYKEVLEDDWSNLGLIQETFVDARQVLRENSETDYDLYGLISQRSNYPVILRSQVSTDYKTGVTSEVFNDEYDFFTGAVTKLRSTDEYGKTTITETVPAYRNNWQMTFGTSGGKNMLLQEGLSQIYTANLDNGVYTPDKLLGASAQTWSPAVAVRGLAPGESSVMRKKASFAWIGPANFTGEVVPFTSYVPFDFTGATSNEQWEKQGEVTLYDIHSHILQAKDINGNYSATKYSSDNMYPFISVANAGYNEIAYSGAEDPLVSGSFGGGVSKETGSVVTKLNSSDNKTTHTGKSAISLGIGQQGFKYSFPGIAGKSYHISVWTNESHGQLMYKIGAAAAVPVNTIVSRKAGEWYLIEKDFKLTDAATIEVWAQNPAGIFCNFDDFRVHPTSSGMTSYVYNEAGQVTNILDGNNMYTEYKYDLSGRLIEVYKETFGSPKQITNKYIYHYASEN